MAGLVPAIHVGPSVNPRRMPCSPRHCERRYSSTPVAFPTWKAGTEAGHDVPNPPAITESALTMLPLDGIRVLSFNHFLMGPLGIQMLGDLGADVIAVEPVDGSWQRHWSGANRTVDGQSLLFLCANRNKRSLTLNLKAPAARDIVHKLVAASDVVAENYRPG